MFCSELCAALVPAGSVNWTLAPDDLNPITLPADVYPIERGICGGWVQAYVKLHSDIITGKLPPRYAIMKSDSSGLGDRLTSSIAVALYAVLTNRAFLYDWRGKHKLWNAYRSTYVDWRYKEQDKALNTSQVLQMSMYDGHWAAGGIQWDKGLCSKRLALFAKVNLCIHIV
jgi:hypothetical protein